MIVKEDHPNTKNNECKQVFVCNRFEKCSGDYRFHLIIEFRTQNNRIPDKLKNGTC